MEEYRITIAEQSKYEIELCAVQCGRDYSVTICGGGRHHVGAAALGCDESGSPRGCRWKSQRNPPAQSRKDSFMLVRRALPTAPIFTPATGMSPTARPPDGGYWCHGL